MDIPYTSAPRQDTGLYNAKVGIWLVLASEVMLFGALFSSYILLRVGAAPGFWPHGWLNVPLGTANTIVLITSSITTVMAWASLKMKDFGKFKFYHAITLLCALVFLGIKSVEYRDKFLHYTIKLKDNRWADGHFRSAVYIDPSSPANKVTESGWRGVSFARQVGTNTVQFQLESVTLNGHIVTDESELFDLKGMTHQAHSEGAAHGEGAAHTDTA